MTLSDRVPDLRARKQTPDSPTTQRPTSENLADRPPLRLVQAATQVRDPQHTPTDDHGPSTDLAGALDDHEVLAQHPPTVAEAVGNLWLARDEVRHGRAGQLAAAAAGLAQVLILLACWGAAHVFGASRTRAALLALVLLLALSTCSIAAHN